MKIYSDVPNPGQEDLQKFINKINETESIVIASEFTNATGRGSTIREVKETKKDEPPNQNRVHHMCGKAHKRGACEVVCDGCGMKGSHKKDKCWKLYPDLRPKDMRNRRDGERGRKKDRSRSKSREGEERKRGRERSSPYPRPI